MPSREKKFFTCGVREYKVGLRMSVTFFMVRVQLGVQVGAQTDQNQQQFNSSVNADAYEIT